MKYRLTILLIPFLALSCTYYGLRGPIPYSKYYFNSMKSIPESNDVVYQLHGYYFPNTFLDPDNWHSFGSESIEGVVFVTNSKLIFAVYNDDTERYYPHDIFDYSNIAEVSSFKHGITRIIRFHAKNVTDNSFIILNSFSSDGKQVDKEKVTGFIQKKVNTDKQ